MADATQDNRRRWRFTMFVKPCAEVLAWKNSSIVMIQAG